MTYYDRALICRNGHLINSCAEGDPARNSKFCEKCGEPAVGQCESCGEPIRGEEFEAQEGWVDVTRRYLGFRRIPQHCHGCGKPYPWTERRAEAIQEVLDELDGLTDEDCEKLKKSIPDIIADTPKSDTAALRFKKAIAKVGQSGGKILVDILTNVATEAVKKTMGM